MEWHCLVVVIRATLCVWCTHMVLHLTHTHCMCTHTTHMRTPHHAHMHTLHTHTHAHTRTHTCTNTHTHTHTHTHIFQEVYRAGGERVRTTMFPETIQEREEAPPTATPTQPQVLPGQQQQTNLQRMAQSSQILTSALANLLAYQVCVEEGWRWRRDGGGGGQGYRMCLG